MQLQLRKYMSKSLTQHPHPRRACVFCASSIGKDEAFRKEAERLGRALASSGWGIVYGGATVGLMGSVANSALAAGGEVIGVIPEALVSREIVHQGLTELHIVKSMHERKALMASLAGAFIALPGGYGTLDEFLEILTWSQLRIHQKPCILVNTGGYYDKLIQFLDFTVEEGFLKPEYRRLMLVAKDSAEALQFIAQQTAQIPSAPAEELSSELIR